MLWSSMPSTSRHHWGTDIDINGFEKYLLRLIDKVISLLSTTILVDSKSQLELLISNRIITKKKSIL